MAGESTFSLDHLIESITAQLDQVQDALVVKAVNRPLTYALKDLSLALQVFVEVDPEGNVRVRPSGPNESGASTIHMNVTTVTRPMIEENTVSLGAVRSPTLDELGLAPAERRRLERLGIRNAAQLQQVNSTAGARAISRLSQVDVERLRQALTRGRPALTGVRPEPAPPPAEPPPKPAPGDKRPEGPPPQVRPGIKVRPPFERPPRELLPLIPRVEEPKPAVPPAFVEPAAPRPPSIETQPVEAPQGSLPPVTRRVSLVGRNLIGEQGPAAIRLNRQPLRVLEADEDRLVVELPPESVGGALEVQMPGGEAVSYQLELGGNGGDPWRPSEGER